MNTQQRAYALARANAEAVAEQMREHEAQFIRDRGIKNPDGAIPESLYMIEDEQTFLDACEAYEHHPSNLYAEHNKAMELLRQAEDALIDYALSIVPAGVAATLRPVRDKPKYRKQMLDLAFRLNTRTVPKGVKSR